MTVDIVMATYNGAKYIKPQILSILAQTYSDWKLLIHDDGSSDETITTIKELQKLDERIVLIEDDEKFGNAGANFLHTLKFSTAPFIMFCDQDDIWFESKIELHLNKIKDQKIPYAVYSNGYTYNGQIITSQNFINFHRTHLKDSLFLNGGIHGCCVMFNKALLDIFNNNLPPYVFMHDHFITMAAVTFGKMEYIDKALMLYRQHDRNVTGNVVLSPTARIKTFLDSDNPVLEKRHYQANESFYQHFNNQLSASQKELFIGYLEYPKVTKIQRLLTILKFQFKSKNVSTLLLKTLIRKAI